jgi:hypothetical protein
VISVAAFGRRSIPLLVVAGLKIRLHTRHLGGNTASRKMFKSDPGQLGIPNLATRSSNTNAYSPANKVNSFMLKPDQQELKIEYRLD